MEKRPEKLDGVTSCKKTPCGNMYTTINIHEGQIVEVFSHLGKTGTCPRAFLEALGRVSSLAIRKGVLPEEIAKSLVGIRCADSNHSTEHSCPHTLSVAIKDVIDKNKEDK